MVATEEVRWNIKESHTLLRSRMRRIGFICLLWIAKMMDFHRDTFPYVTSPNSGSLGCQQRQLKRRSNICIFRLFPHSWIHGGSSSSISGTSGSPGTVERGLSFAILQKQVPMISWLLLTTKASWSRVVLFNTGNTLVQHWPLLYRRACACSKPECKGECERRRLFKIFSRFQQKWYSNYWTWLRLVRIAFS